MNVRVLLLLFLFGICELACVAEDEPSNCKCVPYYLCMADEVVTDGTGIIDIRGGPDCESYLDVCCTNPAKQEEVSEKPPPEHVRSGCGKRNVAGIDIRITGDEHGEAQYAEFPWMVAVLKIEEIQGDTLFPYQCGGSLIHPSVVLTAAHCVNKIQKFRIRAGEWDTQTTKEFYPNQDVDVVETIIHPKYYAGALHNDVALLILQHPVEYAENVDVVCLPEQDAEFDNTYCAVSGWGKSEFAQEDQHQVILKKVEIPTVERDECQDAFRKTVLGPSFKLDESFVCAGGEKGRDACKGDGGSPLVCPITGEKDRYMQAGIVAWGIGCGEDGVPAAYAKVSMFRNWIDDELESRGIDTSSYQA